MRAWICLAKGFGVGEVGHWCPRLLRGTREPWVICLGQVRGACAESRSEQQPLDTELLETTEDLSLGFNPLQSPP